MTDTIIIPTRFNGPPASANGGYAAGVVADPIGPSATVRLLAPPPLGVPLTRMRADDGTVRLLHGADAVAEGRPGRADALASPEPPRPDAVARGTEVYVGFRPENAAYATCFVCGPAREADGLRIFAGPAGEDGLLAANWTPDPALARDGVVDARFVWSALDCPSGYACMPPGSLSVLGTMTATLEAPVHAGRPYVVTAWPIAHDGRKHRAGSALHEADGERRRVAVADTLWITPRAA
jgi:hypothetical protein